MTDTEWNMKYDAKKKEVIDRILGKDAKFKVPSTASFKKLTKRSKKDEVAKLLHTSPFDPWLHEYNQLIHVNHGKVVTYVEEGLDKEVPPPVK